MNVAKHVQLPEGACDQERHTPRTQLLPQDKPLQLKSETGMEEARVLGEVPRLHNAEPSTRTQSDGE